MASSGPPNRPAGSWARSSTDWVEPVLGARQADRGGGGAEGRSRGRRGVGGHARAPDHRGYRDREQAEHQQLLAPFAAEQPHRPADDRAPGGNAPMAGPRLDAPPGQRGRAHRISPSSGSGPGGAAAWSVTRPSRKNTTRSAHEASCASWVTTTAAMPRWHAAWMSRMTVSPLALSNAPA